MNDAIYLLVLIAVTTAWAAALIGYFAVLWLARDYTLMMFSAAFLALVVLVSSYQA